MSFDEWYTPNHVIELVRNFYGGKIDLDPASCAKANSLVQADTFYNQNGAELPWFGNVWCNPPYSRGNLQPFVDKTCEKDYNQLIMLVNNDTDTKWFHQLLNQADAMCLIKGRLKFWSPDKPKACSPRQGQVLFYFGGFWSLATRFNKLGKCIEL